MFYMKKALFFFVALCLFFAFGCEKKAKPQGGLSVLVFITGVVAGSPTYELMAEGALEFARDNGNVSVKIYEAGFNQAEWESQLAEMVSTGQYDIVLGSNPSLPQLCENVGKLFPDQKFIIADAQYEGNPQIRTYLYNQYEQSLFLGYLAGLVTTSSMPRANAQKRIGFIAAQEYPLLTRQIIPGFLDGARLADPEIQLDRRVIGSWADANKAAELASAMMDSGVDVFTSIAGGASRGMIKTAIERGAYVVSFNTNEYQLAPGLVVGCGIMEQKKLVMEILEKALLNEIQYGVSQTVGIKDGYLGFVKDDPAYAENLPAGIRQKFESFLDDLAAGKISYAVPSL
jgi:simple sugar transport system substrate-binding protein